MSRIGAEIRRITKMWGGTTTGNGIGDAVRDLADTLPFSAKIEKVALINKQEVTGVDDGDMMTAYVKTDIPFEHNEGDIYFVEINGKMHTSSRTTESRIEVMLAHSTFDIWVPSSVGNVTLNYDLSEGVGETFTFAIYKEREVVKPIDIKYLPIDDIKAALGIE